MKKILLTILTILIVFILIILLIIFLLFNSNKKIYLNDQNQVEVLNKMYTEFILEENNENSNIILDDSAIKNIITKEYFDDSSIFKLRSLETNCDNPESNYILSLKYNSKKRIIELTLSDTYGNKVKQEYILKIQNGKINYEKNGNRTVLVS
jgi:hypothetical protein